MASPLPILTTPIPAIPQKSMIREIDFSNFLFPPIPPDKISIKLTNGRLPPTTDNVGLVDKMGASLLTTIYGDVTGDQKEDAIAILSLETGGSALPNYIYIYSYENSHPVLLWAFSTGDRADGGLRKVQVENGGLILETYNPKGKNGDCCPMFFDRVMYKWEKSKFVRQGKKETLPNLQGNGSPLHQ